MKKGIYIISIMAIGLVIFGEQLVDFAKFGVASLTLRETENNQEIIKEKIEGEVVLEIDNGDGEIKSSKTKFTEGMTVIKLFNEETIRMGLNSKTKAYSTGILIESIGNKDNGKDGKYWIYYVNGEMSSVSADKKELFPEDKVEFRFEKSPF